MNARLFRHCPLAFVLLLCTTAFAQVERDYPHKQTVEAYVTAFNSGDDAKMSAFFTANLAESSLQQRPMAERIERYRSIHDQIKTLTLRGISEIEMSAEKQSVTAEMRAANGDELTVTFLFDPQPPSKLLGVRIGLGGEGPPAPSSAGPAPTTEEGFKQQLAAYLDNASKKDEFSGVVMVARHGAPIFQHAYGFADKAAKTPNQLDTKFNLGSINKVFTRLSIEQLIAAGKLSIDDTIAKVLPGYPNKDVAQKVNVRQLLNMTSGIGDFFGERYDATPKEKLRTLADYLPLFADKPLLFEPGKGQAYSNGGYVVLGLIIEKISGETYYDYVKQHIFAPAGMTDTDSYLTDEQVANRAEGYTKKLGDGKEWVNNRISRPARGSSAGGGYSTAPDLVKFAEAIASGKLKSSTPGLGIAGGSPGMNAALEYDPAKGVAIVVLSNYDPPSAERVARQIREWMRGI
jgi:D-alanyl-D-alanine carboxypeptidase